MRVVYQQSIYSDNSVEAEFSYVKRELDITPGRFKVDICVEDMKTIVDLNVYITRYGDLPANISFVVNFEGQSRSHH